MEQSLDSIRQLLDTQLISHITILLSQRIIHLAILLFRHSHQHFLSRKLWNSSIPSDKDWIPTIPESQQIDEWFVHLADGAPHVGGAKAASFLKGANLSVDTLRAIWGLIDSSNKGHVDKVQFTRIIQLVAIAKSPIHAGSAPSMDRYFKTASIFPLPPLSTGTPSSAAAPLASVPEPKPANVDWTPSAQEVAIMDGWFNTLDIKKSGYVLGLELPCFFKIVPCPERHCDRCGGLSTQQVPVASRTQFYKIIRSVSIGRFLAHAKKPPSMELYYTTAQELIPLPTFNSPKEAAPPAPVAPAAPLSPELPTPTADHTILLIQSLMLRLLEERFLHISILLARSILPTLCPSPCPLFIHQLILLLLLSKKKNFLISPVLQLRLLLR
jgi:hypothetical protein